MTTGNGNIYGPDEVSAVVFDIGGCLCRAGYAGDDLPRAVYPSSAGVVPRAGGGGGRDVFVGNAALALRREGMEVVGALGSDDLIADADVYNRLIDYAMRERLGAEPSDHALLLSEPTHTDRAARERTVEAVFEAQAAPALYLAKAAVLTAYAVGKQTALVVDAGYRGTTVAAVLEGSVLPKTVSRTALGGAVLTRCTQALIERELAEKGARLMARHMFRRVPIPDFAQYETVVEDGSRMTASYDAWGLSAVAADAKEALVKAGDAAFNEEEAKSMPYALYELPDGTEINVGPDRVMVAETLFNPARLAAFPGVESDPLLASGRQPLSWPALIKGSIDAASPDQEVRKDFWASVVLAGGCALVPNARERLERELAAAAAQRGIKVNAPVNAAEKRFAAWIGGSVLASLSSFQRLWVSRAEYLEHGAGLIHTRSP